MSGDMKALVNYYAREKLYRHVQTVCVEVLKKRGNDATLLFWRAYGKAMEGGYSEAIRELEGIRTKRDAEFATIAALIQYHKQSTVVDNEAVAELEASLIVAESRAPDASKLTAATFYWHSGRHSDAKAVLQQLVDSNPNNRKALTLLGWVALTTTMKGRRGQEQINRSMQHFDAALGGEEGAATSPELEAILGKAKFYERKKQFSKALESLNQAVVRFTWFLPALSEKARVLMMMGDWEQALETAERVLAQDGFDIEALRIVTLHCLTRVSRPDDAAQRVQDLCDSLDRHEPRNPELYYNAARPFARVADRHPAVMRGCMALLQRAIALAPLNSEYAAEMGFQQTLVGDWDGAMLSFREAASLDESNVTALHGMILCQVLKGQLEDAAQQMEFLSVIQDSIGATPEITYLHALLAWRRRGEREAAVTLLDTTVRLHKERLREAAPTDSFTYFVMFNPDFLVQITQEYLQHCGTEPLDSSEPPSSHLSTAIGLLEKVSRAVPGMVHAHLLLARARFISNALDSAARVVSRCLSLDPRCAPAHLVAAQIALAQENYRGANQALEQAMSIDFSIRTSPLYHVCRARVLEKSGELEEAERVLQEAMALPGVRSGGAEQPGAEAAAGGGRRRGRGGESKAGEAGGGEPVPLNDRVNIFLQLAEVLSRLNRLKDASTVVQQAMAAFRGTPAEVRVVVANSELALKRGDTDSALRMLNAVPPTSPAYTKAVMVKASIYLTQRRNKIRYIRCYRELVSRNPGVQTYMLLAEAHLKIQDPQSAIRAYEEAMKLNPGDAGLASLVGRAMVSTHDYLGAIEYYETALRHAPDRVQLRHELADLYTKLGKYDLAARVLDEALTEHSGPVDAATLMSDVKNLGLLARVHAGCFNFDDAAAALLRARQLQSSVLSKLRGEDPQLLRQQRLVAADLCTTLARHYETGGASTAGNGSSSGGSGAAGAAAAAAAEGADLDKARAFYNESLRHDDAHEESMLALARLHMRRGELDLCQQQCSTLLRVDPGAEEATMMMADIMFQRDDHESATYHFQKLLENTPGNFVALSRLIGLLRRAGKLADVPRFLKTAERSSPRAAHAPGMQYCKGLYYRYTNDPHEAIACFNQARRDPEWGERAIIHMVEIYLNPENENMWEDEEGKVESSEAVRVAEKLLRELPTRPKTLRHFVLDCYALMATQQRPNIELAIQRLMDLLNSERNYVPALLGLATALMMLRQTPKARNQLKRIAKMQYSSEDAEEFEKSWLMLADIYINASKYDLAQELCKRCLVHNKSCAKAWEQMGYIMEKEAAYKDAADHYEQAWSFESQASARVGFKLAFNYLKARRYVEAIDVCHKVLEAFPDYPKIKKDILDKARAAIRP